jgi:hypothetical protein
MQTRPDWNTPRHSAHAARIRAIAILQRNVGMTGTTAQHMAARQQEQLNAQPWPGAQESNP